MNLDAILDKILAADTDVAKNIEKWVELYPEYEHELIDFAVVWSIMHSVPEPPPPTLEVENQLISRGMEVMQAVAKKYPPPEYPPKQNHSRPNRDKWFDEVRITTVPRFKESELSGDEWRTSVQVELMRKGNVLFSRRVGDMAAAAAWLGWGMMTVGEDGEDISFPDNYKYCSQSGCSEKATEFFKVITNYNDDGDASSYQPDRWRGFCLYHMDRGNQSYDDSNDNYMVYDEYKGDNDGD